MRGKPRTTHAGFNIITMHAKRSPVSGASFHCGLCTAWAAATVATATRTTTGGTTRAVAAARLANEQVVFELAAFAQLLARGAGSANAKYVIPCSSSF